MDVSQVRPLSLSSQVLCILNKRDGFSLLIIFREEGAAALYKGFVPKVLRLAPGGGVLLLVVEATLSIVRKSKSFLSLFSVFKYSILLSLLLLQPSVHPTYKS